MASKMSLMRLAAIALVAIVGLTAAQNFQTCPAVPSGGNLYPSVQTNCTSHATCVSTGCTCLGGTYNTTSHVCTPTNGTGKTCAEAQVCQKAYIACVNNASLATDAPACLTNLRVAIVGLYAGNAYANSTVDQSCRTATCNGFNMTKVQHCASIAYGDVCVMPAMTAAPPTPTPTNATTNTTAPAPANTTAPATPIPAANKYKGLLKISGNWAPVLANSTATARAKAALETDMTALLRVTTTVDSMVASSLTVAFTADAVATDSAFTTRLASATASSSWLTSTQAAYTAGGGTGTLAVESVTAGTLAPTATPPTPAPPTPSSASTLSVAVAVVVAAVLAMLA